MLCSFIVVENLRYMLYQYHPQTSLYIGHRFAVDYPAVREGYMAGQNQHRHSQRKTD